MRSSTKTLVAFYLTLLIVFGIFGALALPSQVTTAKIQSVTYIPTTGNLPIEYVKMNFNYQNYTVLVSGCILVSNSTAQVQYSVMQGWYLTGCTELNVG